MKRTFVFVVALLTLVAISATFTGAYAKAPITIINQTSRTYSVWAYADSDASRLIACQSLTVKPNGWAEIKPVAPSMAADLLFNDHCDLYDRLQIVVAEGTMARLLDIGTRTLGSVPWGAEVVITGHEQLTCNGCK